MHEDAPAEEASIIDRALQACTELAKLALNDPEGARMLAELALETPDELGAHLEDKGADINQFINPENQAIDDPAVTTEVVDAARISEESRSDATEVNRQKPDETAEQKVADKLEKPKEQDVADATIIVHEAHDIQAHQPSHDTIEEALDVPADKNTGRHDRPDPAAEVIRQQSQPELALALAVAEPEIAAVITPTPDEIVATSSTPRVEVPEPAAERVQDSDAIIDARRTQVVKIPAENDPVLAVTQVKAESKSDDAATALELEPAVTTESEVPKGLVFDVEPEPEAIVQHFDHEAGEIFDVELEAETDDVDGDSEFDDELIGEDDSEDEYKDVPVDNEAQAPVYAIDAEPEAGEAAEPVFEPEVLEVYQQLANILSVISIESVEAESESGEGTTVESVENESAVETAPYQAFEALIAEQTPVAEAELVAETQSPDMSELLEVAHEQSLAQTLVQLTEVLPVDLESEHSELYEALQAVQAEVGAQQEQAVEAAVEIVITPALTEKLLVLIEQLGYERSGEVLVEFVEQHGLAALVQAPGYLLHVIDEDKRPEAGLSTAQLSDDDVRNTPKALGKLLLGMIGQLAFTA